MDEAIGGFVIWFVCSLLPGIAVGADESDKLKSNGWFILLMFLTWPICVLGVVIGYYFRNKTPTEQSQHKEQKQQSSDSWSRNHTYDRTSWQREETPPNQQRTYTFHYDVVDENDETYYDVLGVRKTASVDEIKRAYRAAAKVYHPDQGGSAELFKKATKAKDTLVDPTTRQRYDRSLNVA